MLQTTMNRSITLGKHTPFWIVCLAAILLVNVPQGALEAKKFLLGTDPENLTALDYWASISAYTSGPFMVVIMIMQQRRLRMMPLLNDLGLTHASYRHVGLGLLLGILMGVATIVVSSMLELPSSASTASIIEYHQGVLGVVSLLYIIILSTPVLEEILFRGWLFKRAMDTWLGSYGAALLSSLLFMFIHVGPGVQPIHLFVIFSLAMTLAWLRFRFVSLWPAIAMHAAYNACQITLALLLLH